jgi:hypothetical protein
MEPPFDVFAVRKKNGPKWLGSAGSLIEALNLARNRGAGSYFLFSPETGRETFFDVSSDGVVSPVSNR